MPDCQLIAENAARSIRRDKGKTESAEILTEWQDLCSSSRLLDLYRLVSRLDSVQPADFNRKVYDLVLSEKGYFPQFEGAGEYELLLREIAGEARAQSADAQFVKLYILEGPDAVRQQLQKRGAGKLREIHRAELDRIDLGIGMVMSLTSGAWIPTGNLSTLGNHAAMGFVIGVAFGGWQVGMAADFRFLGAANDYSFYNPNTATITQTKFFFGAWFGPDVRWQALRIGNTALFITGGFGYDMISHLVVQRYSGQRAAYSDSFNGNAGIAIRQYFSDERAGFLELDLRAHAVNFTGEGSRAQDISGGYFTANLAAGYRLMFEK